MSFPPWMWDAAETVVVVVFCMALPVLSHVHLTPHVTFAEPIHSDDAIWSLSHHLRAAPAAGTFAFLTATSARLPLYGLPIVEWPHASEFARTWLIANWILMLSVPTETIGMLHDLFLANVVGAGLVHIGICVLNTRVNTELGVHVRVAFWVYVGSAFFLTWTRIVALNDFPISGLFIVFEIGLIASISAMRPILSHAKHVGLFIPTLS